MIQLNNVRKSFDGRKTFAVDDVSLHVRPGEFIVLLGESGCGKTTTLKMINRLITLTDGDIKIDGASSRTINPVQLRRQIGYVFQNIGLFPHMTVAENIAIVPTLLRWPRETITKRIDELLELVNLPPDDFRDRSPKQLSGGQRQRIGLARALAAKPRIMLMDEPFGALDPLTRDSLQDEFRKMHNHLELTTVMVTHDMTEALLLADRIAVMSEGRIVATGSPHELLTEPIHEYAQQLMDMPRRQADAIEQLIHEGNA